MTSTKCPGTLQCFLRGQSNKGSDTLGHQPTEYVVSLALFDCLIKFTDTPIGPKAHPPSQRMPWENCRAVPSQQLYHMCAVELSLKGVFYIRLGSKGSLIRGLPPTL